MVGRPNSQDSTPRQPLRGSRPSRPSRRRLTEIRPRVDEEGLVVLSLRDHVSFGCGSHIINTLDVVGKGLWIAQANINRLPIVLGVQDEGRRKWLLLEELDQLCTLESQRPLPTTSSVFMIWLPQPT